MHRRLETKKYVSGVFPLRNLYFQCLTTVFVFLNAHSHLLHRQFENITNKDDSHRFICLF